MAVIKFTQPYTTRNLSFFEASKQKMDNCTTRDPSPPSSWSERYESKAFSTSVSHGIWQAWRSASERGIRRPHRNLSKSHVVACCCFEQWAGRAADLADLGMNVPTVQKGTMTARCLHTCMPTERLPTAICWLSYPLHGYIHSCLELYDVTH